MAGETCPSKRLKLSKKSLRELTRLLVVRSPVAPRVARIEHVGRERPEPTWGSSNRRTARGSNSAPAMRPFDCRVDHRARVRDRHAMTDAVADRRSSPY